MLQRLLLSLVCFGLLATAATAENPRVTMKTTQGTIVLELYADKAPGTVKNFLEYVDAKYYDGTVFHRVIPDFMIQGGGFDANLAKKDTGAQIKNEADNGVSNERGTISMARTNAPDSATAQFFINSVDNGRMLDHTDKGQGWGYAVFGKVVEGLDVVDKISGVATGNKNGLQNVPKETVVIESVRLDGAAR